MDLCLQPYFYVRVIEENNTYYMCEKELWILFCVWVFAGILVLFYLFIIFIDTIVLQIYGAYYIVIALYY